MRYIPVEIKQFLEDPDSIHQQMTLSLSVYTKLEDKFLNSTRYVLVRELWNNWQTCFHVYCKDKQDRWWHGCTYSVQDDSWTFRMKRVEEDCKKLITDYREKTAMFG